MKTFNYMGHTFTPIRNFKKSEKKGLMPIVWSGKGYEYGMFVQAAINSGLPILDLYQMDADKMVSPTIEALCEFIPMQRRTIDKIIYPVNTAFGAPMGRQSIGKYPSDKKVYDAAVPMGKHGYDRGGAYWGNGSQLRVKYTKDLSFIQFYRR